MVLKMLPNQVTLVWDYIKQGLIATKPAMHEMSQNALINILKNILIGTLQCWAIVDNSNKVLLGFFLTTIATDYVSGTKFLNVYDLYSFKPLPPGYLEECMKAGNEFAKANECNKIVAYSDIPEIILLAKRHGFKSDCIYLIKEVI